MKFREGDLLRDMLGSAVLIVKEVLPNNRLKVNYHNTHGHEGQVDWVVYAADCIKITV